MPAPTFLGIGAQKAGTSWLFEMVARHPDVCSGKDKEIHFFNSPKNYEKGRDWYEAQFTRNPSAHLVGECTPAYLWTVGDVPPTAHLLGTAPRISAAYPDLRLVASLRDPVERAVSAYLHLVGHGRVRPGVPIEEATRKLPGIVQKGYYALQIKEWLRCFDRDQFLLLVFEEDIRPDPAKGPTLRRVFEHIGADPSFLPSGMTDRVNDRASYFDMRRRHAGRIGRRLMGYVPRRLREHPAWEFGVSEEDRAYLAALYAPEVEALEEILGRPLPWTSTRRLARLE